MSEITIWEFPVPSASLSVVGICLVSGRGGTMLRFNYRDIHDGGRPKHGGLRFELVQAASWKPEHSRDGIRGHDRLVEVLGSEWVSEFTGMWGNNPSFRRRGMPRHFAICLDGAGQFDFLAHYYEIMEARDGFDEIYRRPE